MVWELLIVDNGSTDHTSNIVTSFEDRLPVKRLWQPEPGLSNARNFGIRHAAGKYIIWTDDDVLLDTGGPRLRHGIFLIYDDLLV